MSSLRALVGNENILAECSGLNYSVYVTDSRLLVGKRFTSGESLVNVPHSSVTTLELITKSIIPSLTVSIVAAIGAVLVWFFPGQGQLRIPPFPYDYVLGGVGLISVAGLVASWWRRRIAVLRIGIAGADEPIVIKLVSTSSAEDVFRALKG